MTGRVQLQQLHSWISNKQNLIQTSARRGIIGSWPGIRGRSSHERCVRARMGGSAKGNFVRGRPANETIDGQVRLCVQVVPVESGAGSRSAPGRRASARRSWRAITTLTAAGQGGRSGAGGEGQGAVQRCQHVVQQPWQASAASNTAEAAQARQGGERAHSR